MGISASVKNEQIVASVGESKIDVAVSGGFGPSGAAGAAGQAATVAVGTVTTGAAGSQASVTNVGSSSAAVLNFTIPAGATGPQGPAGGGYTLPVATASVLGGVKIGSGISIDGSGVISASAGYTLPTATDSVLGGVKIGSGVTITDGVISVSTNYAATSHSHTFGEVSTASTYTNFLPEGGDLATALSGIDSELSARALASDFDQGVKTTDAPTFVNLTIGGGLGIYGVFLQDDAILRFRDGTDQTTAWPGTYSYTDLTDKPTLFDGAYTSLTSVPSTFAPSAHKSQHSVGGSDALSPSDIGAAALSHAHSVGDLSLTATDVIVGRYSSGAGVGQEITCTAAGRAILDDATAADQRTTLGLGTAATSNTGDFATAGHTHAQLHDRSHAITSTSDHTAGNWKVLYTNGSGQVVELGLGDSGKALISNGASAAPSWGSAGSNSASDLTTGTLSDSRLSTNAQAAINLYLWSSFR